MHNAHLFAQYSILSSQCLAVSHTATDNITTKESNVKHKTRTIEDLRSCLLKKNLEITLFFATWPLELYWSCSPPAAQYALENWQHGFSWLGASWKRVDWLWHCLTVLTALPPELEQVVPIYSLSVAVLPTTKHWPDLGSVPSKKVGKTSLCPVRAIPLKIFSPYQFPNKILPLQTFLTIIVTILVGCGNLGVFFFIFVHWLTIWLLQFGFEIFVDYIWSSSVESLFMFCLIFNAKLCMYSAKRRRSHLEIGSRQAKKSNYHGAFMKVPFWKKVFWATISQCTQMCLCPNYS